MALFYQIYFRNYFALSNFLWNHSAILIEGAVISYYQDSPSWASVSRNEL